MRGYGLASLALVAFMAAVFVPQSCEAQVEWAALVPLFAKKIAGLWVQDSFDLMGHTCKYTVRPTFKRWKLYFKGTMWCPGWTDIRGSAKTRSQSGVVGQTTTDFVNKAHNAGLITTEAARQWLNTQ